MEKWFENGNVSVQRNLVDDPENPAQWQDKEEYAVYCLFLLSDGRPNVVKLVVDSIIRKDADSPIEEVHAHFFGLPNQRILFKERYLFFGSLEELREYYRKNI